MKTILKFTAALVLVFTVTASFGQTTTSTSKHSKKQKNVKEKPAFDNKIAVSDQAMPAEKSTKGTAKKDNSGISNK